MVVYNKLTHKRFFTDQDTLKSESVGYKQDVSQLIKVGAYIYADPAGIDAIIIDSDYYGNQVKDAGDGTKYRVIRVQAAGVNATFKASENFFSK